MVARPLVIGHRGAPGYLPEHTRASYALALEAGVDAVEPDVVFSRDGVAVVRHENEIGSTTDVAARREFADRRTTKSVDGRRITGWFAEDFTWAELATLRARERMPELRPQSAQHDGEAPILRLADVLDLVASASAAQGRRIGVVLEIKHATYFAGLGIDVAASIAVVLEDAGWAAGGRGLVVESFEPTVLAQLKALGLPADFVFLIEDQGSPFDSVAARMPIQYRDIVTPHGLDELVGVVDGISVAKTLVLDPDPRGRPRGPAGFVAAAHERDLLVYTWTCRPENKFLLRAFRSGGGVAHFGDYLAEWALLAEAGVDGVFVDHPDLGVQFFR